MSKVKIGIINVTGYAGVELARLLSQHPAVELTSVTGRSLAGKSLGEAFPHLAGINLTIEAKLGEVELAFSAMPNQESAKEVIPLLDRGIKVVDISADFRLKDAAAGKLRPSPDTNDAGDTDYRLRPAGTRQGLRRRERAAGAA